jgi:lysylphosphatidylglycerol synthetase-like protein (DUF2156 family)
MTDDTSSKTGAIAFIIICIILVTFAETAQERREDLDSAATDLRQSYESLDSLANTRGKSVLLIGRDTVYNLSQVKLKDEQKVAPED